MAFGDLKNEAEVAKFNKHLEDKSYLIGHEPSQTDVQTFKEFGGKAPTAQFANALRWYNHIKSFSDAERKNFAVGSANPLKTATTTTAPPAKDDDDDVDLFGSDEEDAEADKIREERLKAYADKKSKKPALIAKSSIVLDVKPWDDETDMAQMEKQVRTIKMDGLIWGAAKLVPVGYGIKKLQILCVIEDEKVSVDLLQEEIQNFEDFVQSVDIAAFNKI